MNVLHQGLRSVEHGLGPLWMGGKEEDSDLCGKTGTGEIPQPLPLWSHGSGAGTLKSRLASVFSIYGQNPEQE